jgi:dihydroorotate dehydrogenase (NAD+) catalytic subunit
VSHSGATRDGDAHGTGVVTRGDDTQGTRVAFCGLSLAHPIVNGSGTFDAIAAHRAFGDALLEQFPFSAYVSKTITLQPRAGNPSPRLWEASAGLVNSIGLPNKGLNGYIAEDLPRLAEICAAATPAGADPAARSDADHGAPAGADPATPAGADPATRGVPLVTNVMGASAQELVALVQACERREEIAAVELNVSCPNVRTGLDIGADPRQLHEVVRAVRPHTGKPLLVKLTPNTADVALCAQAAEEGGADAVSLINTLRAMALAPGDPAGAGEHAGARPWLGGRTGGLSGPAVRVIALAQVAAVAARVRIPVVGMGGVRSGRDACDLLEVGASLVAVGTESFSDPAAGARIVRELRQRRASHRQSIASQR